MRHLKLELVVLAAVVGAGSLFGLAQALADDSSAAGYELLDENLEPFRTAFNEASDHVRAVLLVGPT